MWVHGEEVLKIAFGQNQKLAIAEGYHVGEASVSGQQRHLAEHLAAPKPNRAAGQNHLNRPGRDNERAVAALALANNKLAGKR